MDPNANLEEQLKLAKSMIADWDNPNGNGIDQEDAARLAELVISLNEWIQKGGFLPKDWQR